MQQSHMYQDEVFEKFIPLPSKNEGFSKILLLGTTGAGKTTVVQ